MYGSARNFPVYMEGTLYVSTALLEKGMILCLEVVGM
jgi:hypothetical protein